MFRAVTLPPMRNSTPVSACRYCRHYVAEGRRGGRCQRLDSPVKGSWTACPLAIPPFTPAWENFNVVSAGAAVWADPMFVLEQSDTSECEVVSVPNDLKDHADKKVASVSEADVA